MSEKIYLFKRASDGQWIYGQNIDCEHPSGAFRVIPSTDRTKVSIIPIAKNEASIPRYDVPFGNIYNESDAAYASFAALKTGYDGFFSLSVSQSTQPLPLGAAISLNQPMYADTYCRITRPANQTPYSDGDAILDTTGISAQKFPNAAKAAGRGVNFINLLAFTTDTALAGKTIKVVFFTASPASPIADNAAFSYGTANELIRKGTLDLTFGTGINAGTAQLGLDSNGVCNLELVPTGTDVFVQVWLPIGYTPSANSTYILLKASVIQN